MIDWWIFAQDTVDLGFGCYVFNNNFSKWDNSTVYVNDYSDGTRTLTCRIGLETWLLAGQHVRNIIAIPNPRLLLALTQSTPSPPPPPPPTTNATTINTTITTTPPPTDDRSSMIPLYAGVAIIIIFVLVVLLVIWMTRKGSIPSPAGQAASLRENLWQNASLSQPVRVHPDRGIKAMKNAVWKSR